MEESMADIKRIAIMTGGGDCPGLNAVIRAVVKTAITKYGLEVVGIKKGYHGLYHKDFIDLTLDKVQEIIGEVPMAEMSDFSTSMRSITQGTATFTLEPTRYEEVPTMITQKIIDANK